MTRCIRNFLILGFLGGGLSACVGPVSPFGGLEIGTGDGQALEPMTVIDDTQRVVQYQPKRQVLHEARDLNIVLQGSEIPSRHKDLDIRVEYNGRDVTHAFKRYLRVSGHDEDELLLAYEDLRLSPTKSHDIRFYFSNNGGKEYVRSHFMPPKCLASEVRPLVTTNPFAEGARYKSLIDKYSQTYKLNAAMLGGLIAQESGFKPNAKSRKKAVGLTQITDLAKNEIEKQNPTFQKYSTKSGEWRSNPERAIEGGAAYLSYLQEYWSDTDSQAALRKANIEDPTSIYLASYNSGAARVKKSVIDFGPKWLEQENLREAYRYVNSVSSYCYQFSGERE